MIHTTPKEITKEILKFCEKKIDPTTKPIFLKLVPVGKCRLSDCFGNVEDYMENNCGSIQYGWIIWDDIDNCLLDAEFHAVWVNEKSECVDITPKKDGEKEILFIPDSIRKDEGGVTSNILWCYKIKTGINKSCPCMSGKKYKMCCMKL